MDSLPDTVALDWHNISCSIYKVGCCQDCLTSHLWSCPWLQCRLSTAMSVVMLMAALLKQTFYSYVCSHVHGYTAHADLLELCLGSRLWLQRTFCSRIQDNWCLFKYLENEGMQQKKNGVLTKTTFAHVSMHLCKLIMAPGNSFCSYQKALNFTSRHPGCHSLELCIVYPGAGAEGPELCHHCCKALARGKPHLASIGSLGCSRQHSMHEQQRVD